jgi:hypothetical protein
MKTALAIVLCVGSALTLSAAEAPTALKSLKALPAGAVNRLAIIDGHDGAPTPARWHFLVEDPTSENGLREFVVAGREVVADREVSQFATRLAPEDVLGKTAVKIDSDAVARTAERYATANELAVVSMNFRLRKDDLTDTPVWTVTCQDADGKAIASLVVDSRDGRVLAHEGFALVPPPPMPTIRPVPKREAAPANPRNRRVNPGERPPPVFQGPDEDDRPVPVRRAEPVRRDRPPLPDPARDVIQPVRRLIHRLFPF